MIINMEDVYETVSGRRVDILNILELDSPAVVGLVETKDGNWAVYSWDREGYALGGHSPECDLRPAVYKAGTKVITIARCWEAVIVASAICPMSKQLYYVVSVTDETAWRSDRQLVLLESNEIELDT